MKKVFMFVLAAVLAIGAATGTRAQIAVDGDSALLWKTLPYQHGVTGEILNAVYSPDETKIIVTTTEKWCELDAETGAFIRMLPDNIRGLAKFTENGEYFISYALQKVRYADFQVLGQYKMPEDIAGWTFAGFDVNDKANVLLAFIHHGQQQPVPKNSIISYDYSTFQEQKRTGMEGHYMNDLKISPTGEYFLTQTHYNPDLSTDSENRWVCTQWDLKTLELMKEVPQLEMPSIYIEVLAFSDDGKKLACASDNKVDVYDENIQLLDSYSIRRDMRMGLDFSNDAKYLVVGANREEGLTNSVNLINLDNKNIDYKFTYNLTEIGIHRVILNNAVSRILSLTSSEVRILKIKKLGINDNSNTPYGLLTPNPTKGKTTLKLESFRGAVTIELLDTRGKKIIKEPHVVGADGKLELDVYNIPSGAYFLTCVDERTGSIITSLKLIKE